MPKIIQNFTQKNIRHVVQKEYTELYISSMSYSKQNDFFLLGYFSNFMQNSMMTCSEFYKTLIFKDCADNKIRVSTLHKVTKKCTYLMLQFGQIERTHETVASLG